MGRSYFLVYGYQPKFFKFLTGRELLLFALFLNFEGKFTLPHSYLTACLPNGRGGVWSCPDYWTTLAAQKSENS
jgi:hypothetical protein